MNRTEQFLICIHRKPTQTKNMALKGKAPTPAPSQPPPEEDDHHEHLEERIKRLIEQQQEDARKEKEEILKHMEDLISNHLSPLTSRNPTPMLMPSPPGNPSGPGLLSDQDDSGQDQARPG